jgi:hypothetical protein
MLTAQPVAEEASQGNNLAALQRVPAQRRSDSMFATSEFLQLPAESVTDDRITDSELSTL